MYKQARYLTLRSAMMLTFGLSYVTLAYGKTPASDTSLVQVTIKPVYNGAPLVTGTQYYVNALNDTFYIDAFRLYISNVSFGGVRNYQLSNNHLFDIDDTRTSTYIVGVPRGVYEQVQFTVGVDSADNTSGANDGDLDPAKGMYWAWNSGYIMAKLEGHSTACKTLHHAFEFHIGGYMPPYNTVREVKLSLPQRMDVSQPGVTMFMIEVDLAKWLNDIDLSKTNSILIPGKDAMMMADKYAKMFSVAGISNQSSPR